MTVRIIAGTLDLFGAEVMQRSARFVDGGRIELHRAWGPGPTACVIGHNPSEAGADRDDQTSRWWIEWFRLFGFGRFVAVNLYPFVTADPAVCREIVAEIDGGVNWGARDLLHYVNLPAVVRAAKAADQVFVCWGAIARDALWIDHVVEEIQTGEGPYPLAAAAAFSGVGLGEARLIDIDDARHPPADGTYEVPAAMMPAWRAIGDQGTLSALCGPWGRWHTFNGAAG